MLSVYFDTFKRGIAFQVAKQSNTITDYINRIGGSFFASNGWTVAVGTYPELDIAGKTIFLQGNDSDLNLRVDRKWDLSSDSNRDFYIKQANNALQELVDAASRPKELRIAGGVDYAKVDAPKNMKTSNNSIAPLFKG